MADPKTLARLLIWRTSLRVQARGHKFARGGEHVLDDVRREFNLTGELPEVLAAFEKIVTAAIHEQGLGDYFDYPAKPAKGVK